DLAVWLIDTWQQEVARRLPFEAAPLDLAGDGDAVYLLLADGSVWQLAPCETPQRTKWPAIPGADRLVVDLSSKRPAAWVLVHAGRSDATLHPLHLGGSLAAPFCTD